MRELLLSLALAPLAAPRADDAVVERVSGAEPIRLNVRCRLTPARSLIQTVARAGRLELVSLPEEFAGPVGPVALRAVPPTRAVEAIAGSLGYMARFDGSKVSIERAPDPNERNARTWYLEHAKTQFEEFLAFDGDHPRSPAAWYELAMVHEELGDFEAELDALQALRETRPDAAEAVDALVQIGRIELLRGNLDEAAIFLTRAVDKHASHPACAEAYALLGRCRLAADAVDMAQRYFRIGLERFPNAGASLSTRIWRVEAMRRLGQVEKAWIEVAELEGMPLSVGQAYELLEVRAELAAATGHDDEATESWLALAAAERNAGMRRRQLGRAASCARKAGDWVCELFIRATLAGEAKSETVGRWLVDQGFPEAALHQLSADSELRLRLAESSASRGDVAAAEALLRSVPIAPEWVPLRKLAEAEIALRSGEPARVPKILSAAIAASTDKAFVSAAFRKLANAYLALGDFGRAESALRGVVPKEEAP